MSKVITPARRARLEKLAAYLESLPKGYQHFGMSLWLNGADDRAAANYALHNGGVSQCGTAACAVGHGPAAGILFPRRLVIECSGYAPDLDWPGYAELFIGDWGYGQPGRVAFNWMFEGDWDSVDNHHYGAAARIRYFLDKGAPPEGFDRPRRKWRAAYAPYRIDAKARADA